MAMAVGGRGKHFQWERITRKHWAETARLCGLKTEIEGILSELIENADRVVGKAAAMLPAGFPSSVAEPVLSGLKKAAKRLAR